jgi:hypothetical protein
MDFLFCSLGQNLSAYVSFASIVVSLRCHTGEEKKTSAKFFFSFFPANKLKASHRPNVGTINPVHLSLYTLMVSRVEQHGVSECLCKAPFKRENRIGND